MNLKDELDKLVKNQKFISIDDIDVKLTKWEFEGSSVNLTLIGRNGEHYATTKKIDDLKGDIERIDRYNFNYLRKKLIDQIEQIENGNLDPAKAKAVSTHVQTVVNITKLELEYKKTVAKDLDVEGIKLLES